MLLFIKKKTAGVIFRCGGCLPGMAAPPYRKIKTTSFSKKIIFSKPSFYSLFVFEIKNYKSLAKISRSKRERIEETTTFYLYFQN
jgi:hypothetical protein